MATEKRIFKCIGCGESRSCLIKTEQEMSPYFEEKEQLKCILDDTNQSFEWIEVDDFF